MDVRALLCCHCGGPLAKPDALPALVDCLYCGTVNSATREATKDAGDTVPWEVRKRAIAAFTEALVKALEARRPPFEAIRECSAAHLGVSGRADTVARIVLALAQDFERDAGVSVVRDATVLSRIAQAYLLALDELRTSEVHELNLPFLTASARGPAHLQRRLTAKLLAELAARDPNAKAPAPEAGEASEASEAKSEAKKKRGWWPFS